MFTRDALPKQQIASFSALADGIIDMRIRKIMKGSERKMRIEKYGPEHEFTGWFPYRISREGLTIVGTASQRIKATLDKF
jgi:KaiC/GvpD/RAD55 family RecA-like ATPase